MAAPKLGLFDWVHAFLPRPKPVHLLKWKIPEARLTAPVDDAETIVGKLKGLKARFISGGEYRDVVYFKEFGEGVMAYFIVRTDVRTSQETLLFEGYQLEEEEPLGLDVESAFGMMKNLQQLGYSPALERKVVVWKFQYGLLPVVVYDVDGFGDFVELALPSTKLVKARELNQKQAEQLLTKLGLAMDQAVPTDVITLQYLSQREGKQGPDDVASQDDDAADQEQAGEVGEEKRGEREPPKGRKLF